MERNQNSVYKTIGQNIAFLRKANHLSQRDLAEALGISAASLSNYESGTQSIRLEMLMDICRRFSVRPDDMMNEDLRYNESTLDPQLRQYEGVYHTYSFDTEFENSSHRILHSTVSFMPSGSRHFLNAVMNCDDGKTFEGNFRLFSSSFFAVFSDSYKTVSINGLHVLLKKPYTGGVALLSDVCSGRENRPVVSKIILSRDKLAAPDGLRDFLKLDGDLYSLRIKRSENHEVYKYLKSSDMDV